MQAVLLLLLFSVRSKGRRKPKLVYCDYEKSEKKEDDMNHSLRPPENNYLMLVLTKQTIQSIVITNVIPSITVVSESNNIIFTLNLSNY